MFIHSNYNQINQFLLAMPAKTFNKDLFFQENSLFQPLTTEMMLIIENKSPIIDSDFSICFQAIRLELFNEMLKLTFLTPKNEQSSIPLFLKLDHEVKAAILTEKKDGSGVKTIGFSIFKEHTSCYEFCSSEEDIVNRWMKELSKLVFLSGFSNDYKAVKYIGRGEFAQVWEVERLRDGAKFAAKTIDKEICYGQVNGRQAIFNEIQILKKLNHSNIVHLECIYESEKSLYIVMEQIQGFLFSEITKKKKSSSETESSAKSQKNNNINIMKNLLKAIKYLHDIGIAHRDLKPGNIIINPDNWMPSIIDFGLSQFIDKQEFLFQCCGSPGYMAPQIFKNQNVHDLKKCDIFSLGAIFFMLLTREPLFNGNSTEEIIEQTKNSKTLVKKKVKSHLHGPEAKLLLEMLEQDPEKRLSAEQALSHDFFLDAMFDYLKQIRKPTDPAEQAPTIKCSSNEQNFQSKFQELFSQSIVFVGNKFGFFKEHEKENMNFSQNMSRNIVEPSLDFTQKIKRRSSRYMSEQNIQINFKIEDRVPKMGWSGKWKNFKTLEQILMTGNFWHVKDFNVGY